ncbi:DUF2093 domain-containing protein [Marinicauda algicola]|uniref:DUF2093 domain-containing protein n=1 Tax=Marinicauda algicola TaxID=2029849 RepID=A0A4S2GYL4_9PROT|nr:DUF2093 domain-containing protein [Marinicauda algicola]TGY88320.1 DUF2093 domain-containing protein [Marinicauda algicola]
MNHFDREFTGEAKLEYGDADYLILSPGAYVTCAVTGAKIPLNDLRYWSAELQEAYRDAEIATKRWLEVHTGPGVKPGESA